MGSRGAGYADVTPSATTIEVDVVERASPDLTTTTTADPGTGGTTLAVTLRDRFPQAGSFKIDVVGTSGIAERMLVTAGQGTGAGSFTVTRAQDGTAAVAHSVGAKVAQVFAVQRMEPVDGSKQVSYKGRAATFRTPGRAGTTGQKIFALHNATASTALVDIVKLKVDLVTSVVKAITVLPPLIRLYTFTAVPTNGTVLTKNTEDTALSSKAAVTVWGDASADGTGSATALTIGAVTIGAQSGLIDQEYSSRMITGAGYEMTDRTTFFELDNEVITLRALQGLVVHLDYNLATMNPITDMWVSSVRWLEYTAA